MKNKILKSLLLSSITFGAFLKVDGSTLLPQENGMPILEKQENPLAQSLALSTIIAPVSESIPSVEVTTKENDVKIAAPDEAKLQKEPIEASRPIHSEDSLLPDLSLDSNIPLPTAEENDISQSTSKVEVDSTKIAAPNEMVIQAKLIEMYYKEHPSTESTIVGQREVEEYFETEAKKKEAIEKLREDLKNKNPLPIPNNTKNYGSNLTIWRNSLFIEPNIPLPPAGGNGLRQITTSKIKVDSTKIAAPDETEEDWKDLTKKSSESSSEPSHHSESSSDSSSSSHSKSSSTSGSSSDSGE